MPSYSRVLDYNWVKFQTNIYYMVLLLISILKLIVPIKAISLNNIPPKMCNNPSDIELRVIQRMAALREEMPEYVSEVEKINKKEAKNIYLDRDPGYKFREVSDEKDYLYKLKTLISDYYFNSENFFDREFGRHERAKPGRVQYYR